MGDAGVARAVVTSRVTSEGLRQWSGRLCGYIPLGDGGDGRAADHRERRREEGTVEGSRKRGKERVHEGDCGWIRECRMEDGADAG